MKVTQKQLFDFMTEYEGILDLYKRKFTEGNKRDWRTYEQRLALRAKKASIELLPIIERAYAMIGVPEPEKELGGRPPKATVPQKVLMLLIKDIFQISNRKMASMLDLFAALNNIDISYKTLERAYSEDLVKLTIHNAFAIIAKDAGIKESDTCGDGTGYSLTVTKHYRNEREKQLKRLNGASKKAKPTKSGNKTKKRRLFVYSFALMDLDTHMYIGYATSMKSEKEAFRKAVSMAGAMGIKINSARLDKYYSCPSIVNEFAKNTTIYVLPKSNATINGPFAWKSILKSIMNDPIGFLRQYFLRNHSECGFSVDKNMCGRKVWQKLDDRIDTALLCKGLWHNLMLMG